MSYLGRFLACVWKEFRGDSHALDYISASEACVCVWVILLRPQSFATCVKCKTWENCVFVYASACVRLCYELSRLFACVWRRFRDDLPQSFCGIR